MGTQLIMVFALSNPGGHTGGHGGTWWIWIIVGVVAIIAAAYWIRRLRSRRD